jgi:hypothetical protein
MSRAEIQSTIEQFATFIQNSDGIVSVDSQSDSTGGWADQTPSGIHNAHHLNSLRTQSIIQEAVNFHSSYLPATPRIVLVAPEWMGTAAWADVIAAFVSNTGVASSFSTTDLATTGPHTIQQIQSLDLTSLNHAANFHIVIPSINVHVDSNAPEFLAHQLRSVVERIFSQTGDPVFLVGHSVGGLAVRYYTDGLADLAPDGTPNPPESKVYGAMTISTPHHSAARVYYDENRLGFVRFLHLLRLMGSIEDIDLLSIDPATFSLSDVTGSGGLPNLTEDYLKQMARLIFDSESPHYIQDVISQ